MQSEVIARDNIFDAAAADAGTFVVCAASPIVVEDNELEGDHAV